jgi:hypothetical protein
MTLFEGVLAKLSSKSSMSQPLFLPFSPLIEGKGDESDENEMAKMGEFRFVLSVTFAKVVKFGIGNWAILPIGTIDYLFSAMPIGRTALNGGRKIFILHPL